MSSSLSSSLSDGEGSEGAEIQQYIVGENGGGGSGLSYSRVMASNNTSRLAPGGVLGSIQPDTDRRTDNHDGKTSMKDPQAISASSAHPFHDSKLDSKGDYKIYPYFMCDTTREPSDDGSHSSPRPYVVDDVTLASHGSFHHVGHVVGLVERWQGKVSVSLFGLETDLDMIRPVIASLRECYPVVKQNVSFHLVHPITVDTEKDPPHHKGTLITQQDRPNSSLSSSFMRLSPSCTTLHNSDLLTMNRPQKDQPFANFAQDGIPYPINLLRNVARTETTSTYVLVMDIDMLPSANMRTDFVRLAASTRLEQRDFRKTVFTLPTFEVRSNEADMMPLDKADLLKLLKQDNARQFYATVCPDCQHQTDYHRWENTRVGMMCFMIGLSMGEAHHSTTKLRLVTPFDLCTSLIFMMFCNPAK